MLTCCGGGPGARKKLDIGDVDEFRKQLAQQRDQLRLWIIKAKQEWEEKQSGAGHRGETNDQEQRPQRSSLCRLFLGLSICPCVSEILTQRWTWVHHFHGHGILWE